jgi:hypothetical protein
MKEYFLFISEFYLITILEIFQGRRYSIGWYLDLIVLFIFGKCIYKKKIKEIVKQTQYGHQFKTEIVSFIIYRSVFHNLQTISRRKIKTNICIQQFKIYRRLNLIIPPFTHGMPKRFDPSNFLWNFYFIISE